MYATTPSSNSPAHLWQWPRLLEDVATGREILPAHSSRVPCTATTMSPDFTRPSSLALVIPFVMTWSVPTKEAVWTGTTPRQQRSIQSPQRKVRMNEKNSCETAMDESYRIIK